MLKIGKTFNNLSFVLRNYLIDRFKPQTILSLFTSKNKITPKKLYSKYNFHICEKPSKKAL